MAGSTYYSGPEFRWRIVGGPVDLTFDMPGTPLWQRKWRGRRAQVLSTKREQVEIRALGPRGIQLTIQVRPGPNQASIVSQIETIFENPQTIYTIYQPGRNSKTVSLDPETDVQDRQEGGAIIYQFGIVEATAPVPASGTVDMPNAGNPLVYGDPYTLTVTGIAEDAYAYMAVGWDNIPTPSAGDWAFLNPRDSTAYTDAVAEVYTGGVAQGTGVIRVASGVPTGEYKLRLLLYNYNGAVAIINGPDVDIV
jgi:hypothetical protein